MRHELLLISKNTVFPKYSESCVQNTIFTTFRENIDRCEDPSTLAYIIPSNNYPFTTLFLKFHAGTRTPFCPITLYKAIKTQPE